MKRTRVWIAGALALAVWCVALAARAEVSNAELEKLTAVEQSLERVVSLYKSKKYDEMAMLVSEIAATVKELSANSDNAELAARVAPLEQRLAAAQRLVATQQELKTAAAEAARPMPRPAANRPTPARSSNDVSFVNDVAPILVAKCQGCHIRGNRGGFSLATYAQLMAGTPDGGPVFRPGRADGSRLMDLLQDGAMPPNGNACSPEELALISRWINSGANFDGPNPTMQLTALVTGGAAMAGDLSQSQATGNESVKFMRDIAPVLVDNCIRCHSGDRPSENLSLASFAGIMSGGRSGVVVKPGDPRGSILIQKLKGTARIGGQMPLNEGPLSPDVIARFETWVAEGAKFDGWDPQMSIDLAVRILLARTMSHGELATMRAANAQLNWKTFNTEETPDRYETDDLVLFGNIGPVRLEEVGQLAEAQRKKVVSTFKLPADKPFIKGKLTIFAFNRRFDYNEFGQMVEKRELPREYSGHWFNNVVNAYVAMHAPEQLDNVAAATLAEAMTGAYLDSLAEGRLPRWFAIGAARNYAAKMEPNNPIVKQTEQLVASALANGAPDRVLNTNTLDAGGSAISYGFVKSLMANSSRYNALMAAIKEGKNFNRSFQDIYRTDPKTAITAWARSGGR